MRYNAPEKNVDENTVSVETDNNERVYFEGRPRGDGSGISEQTAFMRWSTEFEAVDNIVDTDFLKRNRIRIIDINKILPLSFIEDPKSIKLFRLRRMNMEFSDDAGLIDLAEGTTMDNLADYQTTRGVRGNYQNALITQRREWKDNNTQQNKHGGLFSKLIRKNTDESKGQLMEG